MTYEDEKIYTLRELADLLGLHEDTIRKKIASARKSGIFTSVPIMVHNPETGRSKHGVPASLLDEIKKLIATHITDTVAELPELLENVDVLEELTELENKLYALLKKVDLVSLDSIADALDISPAKTRSTIDSMNSKGYKIAYEANNAKLDRVIREVPGFITPTWNTGSTYKVGIISDIHMANEHSKVESVKAAYKYFEESGCQFAVNVGDVFDGPPQMHRSKLFGDLKISSLPGQLNFAKSNYPTNIKTVFIGGNHDASWHIQSGVNPVEVLCSYHDNWHYLGETCGFIQDDRGRNLIYLYHPSVGAAYGRSNTSQRDAEWVSYSLPEFQEALSGQTQQDYPRIIIVGHHHKFNIHPGPFGSLCLLAPAACGMTTFQRNKRLANDCGAMILEFSVTEDNAIEKFTQEVIWFRGGDEVDYGKWQQSSSPTQFVRLLEEII